MSKGHPSKAKLAAIAALLALASFAGLVACTPQSKVSFTGAPSLLALTGTETGNPNAPTSPPVANLSIQLGSFSAGAAAGLSLCPTSINLKPQGAGQPAVQIAVNPGRVSVGGADVPIATVPVPIQAYEELDVVTSNACASGGSVQVTNAIGGFSTENQVILHFSGPFSVESATNLLKLAVQPIVDQVAAIGSDAELESSIEGASGQVLAYPIAFRQLQENRVTSSGNSIDTSVFPSQVNTGNLMVCWSFYQSATQSISGIVDTAGNSYVRAAGPITGTQGPLSGFSQEIWYAANLTGGSNFSITASFNGTTAGERAISCCEYAGVATASPMDTSVSSFGDGVNAATSQIATHAQNELVFAAATFDTTGTSGPGFTQRSSLRNNVSEDSVVGPAGLYTAAFTNASMNWIAQVVSFKGN